MSSSAVVNLAGLLIGLAGIIFSYVTYRRTREDKHLDYEVVVNTRVLVPEHVDEGLELRYKDTGVVDPYLTIVRFINTGNRPIAPSDQIEPLSVTFTDPDWLRPRGDVVERAIRVREDQRRVAQIARHADECADEDEVSIKMAALSARRRIDPPVEREILSASPVKASIPLDEMTISLAGDRAEIAPTLLNQGDWIAVRFLIDGPAEPEIAGRIVGVKELRPSKPSRPYDFDSDWLFHLILPSLPVLVAWTLYFMLVPENSQTADMNRIFIAISGAALALGFVYAHRRERRLTARDEATRITF